MEEKLIWHWNKKPIEINKLEDNQLYTIIRSIKNSKNKVWFNTQSSVWLTNINSILEQRNKSNMIKIINDINIRRIQRANFNANIIANGIIKSFKNN